MRRKSLEPAKRAGACVVSRLEPWPRYPRRGLCIRWISIVRALDVPARSKTIAARGDATMASQGVGDVYYARTIPLHRCACGCLHCRRGQCVARKCGAAPSRETLGLEPVIVRVGSRVSRSASANQSHCAFFILGPSVSAPSPNGFTTRLPHRQDGTRGPDPQACEGFELASSTEWRYESPGCKLGSRMRRQ